MKRLFGFIALLLLSFNSAYGVDKVAWEERIKQLKADSSVLRLYSFDEGEGAIVNNLAGDKIGALCMVGYSPYNTFRGFPKKIAQAEKEYPRWTFGRWPWKKAVTCGNASPQFVRSQYHGLDVKVFSVEAWIKPHALEDGEWDNGFLLHIPHGIWGSGWSIRGVRAHWCSKGRASFRIGVKKGTFEVYSDRETPFAFGKWNHLVAVYTDKEIKIYINGKMTSKPITKKINMSQPRGKLENDIKGLEIGGKLRFDIDELVIYNRALSDKEIKSNFNKFKPGQSALTGLAPDKVKFTFPCETGGYFPLKKPINCSINVPPKTKKHTAEFKVIRCKDNETVKQKKLEIGEAKISSAFSFIPDQFGLYNIDMALYDLNGLMVRKETFPIAVTPQTTVSTGLIIHHDVEIQSWGKSLGIEWARVVLPWNMIEPKKNLFDWDLADRKIDSAIDSGMKVLCCITGIPKWVERDPQNKLLPVDLKQYQTFIKTVASRYRRNIHAWEIWDKPFTAPMFYFRNEKKLYEKLVEAAQSAIKEGRAGKTVIDSSYWYAVCGVSQPADRMGSYNPGNMNDPFYKGRLFTEDGQTGVKTWPYRLFSEDASVAFFIKKILGHRVKTANILLGSAPDKFYPSWNSTDGIPSKQGAAIAALYSLMDGESKVEALGQKATISLFLIESKGKNISVLVNNGNETKVKFLPSSSVKGIDCYGNKLKLAEDSSIRFKTIIYVFGKIEPAAIAIEKINE